MANEPTDDESVVCSECLAEPCDGEDGAPDLSGWETEGEFGARCPECCATSEAVGSSEGIAGVAEAAAVEEKAPGPAAKPKRHARKKKGV